MILVPLIGSVSISSTRASDGAETGLGTAPYSDVMRGKELGRGCQVRVSLYMAEEHPSCHRDLFTSCSFGGHKFFLKCLSYP